MTSTGTSADPDKVEIHKLRKELQHEKKAKRKLATAMIKMANELKNLQEGKNNNTETAPSPWYEGGVWPAPTLLPSVQDPSPAPTSSSLQKNTSIVTVGNDPVSLSDLFFDLVIVTAFSRVGVAIQENGSLNGSILAYFAIFWLIWGKEASYVTRFNTNDLPSQLSTLFTCIAILFGSLSSNASFDDDGSNSIMKMAMFVSILHFLLHLRVYQWFKDTPDSSNLHAVRQYAILIMTMTSLESITWIIGINFVSEDYRYIVFIIGILFSIRIPRSFLQNDFHGKERLSRKLVSQRETNPCHITTTFFIIVILETKIYHLYLHFFGYHTAACSKRGVLFIVLLGFVLQNIFLVATPFFTYSVPTMEQYVFLTSAILLLFCIKLLYVDDSNSSMIPTDHALLVSRAAGFLYHIGQFALLLSTTTLGAGLNILTKSYLAHTESLPEDAQLLVCAGFSAVITSIAFIKSLHVRRVPIEEGHKMLFYAAFVVQSIVGIAIVLITASMCVTRDGLVGYLVMNDIEMLGVLVGFSFFLLLVSWLDEGIELSLYGGSSNDDNTSSLVENARNYRVHPFGIWFCLKPSEPDPPVVDNNDPSNTSDRKKLSHLSPLISSSQKNLFGSGGASSSYGSLQKAGEKNPEIV